MSGERYAERAVKALKDYVTSNLAAYLRAVETAQGLDEDSLTDPVAYLDYAAPDDYRSPMVMVWTDGGEVEDWQHQIESYDCTVALLYSGDANIGAGQIKMRRYLTALLQCLRADRTLGGNVQAAIDEDRELNVSTGKNSVTWHELTVGVTVRLMEE